MTSSSENYSLWLTPAAGPVTKKLSQEIATQAKEHSAPLFEAHVTLLGGIQGEADDIIQKSEQLTNKLKRFRINFLDVSQGSTFHRCVYLLVAKEQAVMDAGRLARQEFGMQGDYMPHLSLLYADLSPEARHATQQTAVQRLYGEGANYSTLLTDNGVTVDAVTLWCTPAEDKTLSSWKQVAEFKLQD